MSEWEDDDEEGAGLLDPEEGDELVGADRDEDDAEDEE
jgi:hypothetical protein